ncbi:hypothetical protein [Petrachloros mirabilis]
MPVKDRPDISIELQGDGIKVSWGPQRGPWGIYKKNVDPVDVDIKEWLLYVGYLVNSLKPELGSHEIYGKSVGTKTELLIPKDQLPQGKKTAVAQVLGVFDSRKEDGTDYEEGIYSDMVQKELKY